MTGLAAAPSVGVTPKSSPYNAYRYVLALAAASLPAVLSRGTIETVSSLRDLSGASPYFHPEHAWLLYLWAPIVAVSSFVLYLLPGLLIIMGMRQSRNAFEVIPLSYGASLVSSIVLETAAKAVFGVPLRSNALLYLWIGWGAVAAAFFVIRGGPSTGRGDCESHARDRRRVISMVLIAAAAVALLTPKIFWENFNIDGMEGFEFGRSLTEHILPFWDVQGGAFGFYHNFLLFAYPNHWFIALFGPIEAAVRLPYILHVILLFALLALIIEENSARPLRALEDAALWLGLALFSVVQIYNTTYDPFFCDMAEPGATDSLMLVCFLSACYCIWTHRTRGFMLFAILTYLATVGGSALLLALGVTIVLSHIPRKREYLKAMGWVAAVCGVVALAHETLYNHLVLGGAKDQFSTRNMAARLFPPTLTEFRRLAAIVFPSGLLPALSLLMARRKDWIAWSAAVMTLLYGGLIYSQSWTALHQFTPAMILPLIVFWRVYLNQVSPRLGRWLLPAAFVATAVCMILSLPRHFQINQAVREFGETTDFRVGAYDGPGYQTAVRAGIDVLGFLLPGDYRIRYPEQPWGIDDESWVYYAFQPKAAGAVPNYIVQDASEAAPAGATLAGTSNGFTVYVRNVQAWQRDRDRTLPRVIQSRLYEPILSSTCRFFRQWVAKKQREQQQKQ